MNRSVSLPFWSLSLASTMLTAVAPVWAGGGPVVGDDFDDNMIGELWGVIETNPALITVQERNMRLEFPAAANNGLADGAALFGNGWGLSVTEDFAMRIDVHAALPTIQLGDVGMEFTLAFEVDFPNQTVMDAVSLYVGSDEDGPYLGYEVEIDGAIVDEFFTPRSATDLTLFVWYDAPGDGLRLSDVGFNDPNAAVIPQVRARMGTDRAVVLLSAFTEGTAPAVPGQDLFFDDFVVETGTVVPVGIPGPPDVNGDGAVDVLDLLEVLTAWGPCPPAPCPADITGDGTVDVLDLLEVLTAWGD